MTRLSHHLDHLVKRDSVKSIGERSVDIGIQCPCGCKGVALNTGDLHETTDGITCQSQVVLKPHLSGENDGKIGKMVMGTVYGDLHDIGKNLVIMMIESSGYEVVDLGIDVSIEKFVQAAEDPNVTVVGVSALLTTTMPAMKEVVAALNKSPRRKDFKIMVGGAPITQEFCDEIGADVYTPDAASAGQAAKKLAMERSAS